MNRTQVLMPQVAMSLTHCCATLSHQAQQLFWQVMKVNALQVWQHAR
jgi:hypothetical protein